MTFNDDFYLESHIRVFNYEKVAADTFANFVNSIYYENDILWNMWTTFSNS